MRKFLIFTAAAAMAAALATPNAFAQRDAGSKARGDMTDFWGTRNRRSTSRMSSNVRRMRVMPSTAESYRSYSYVPTAPSPAAGDEVVVTGDDTKMMTGSEVVATIPRGTKFTVTKVIGGWLGASIEIDGKAAKGWIQNSEATLEVPGPASEVMQNSAEDVQSSAVAAQPQAVQEYRSFSYRPNSVSPQRNRSETNPSWRYLKTDPRRHTH